MCGTVPSELGRPAAGTVDVVGRLTPQSAPPLVQHVRQYRGDLQHHPCCRLEPRLCAVKVRAVLPHVHQHELLDLLRSVLCGGDGDCRAHVPLQWFRDLGKGATHPLRYPLHIRRDMR
jgi:hypothetical protein